MNPALEDSKIAFRELLATSGEKVDLWNGNSTIATVRAVIDRGMSASPLDRGDIQFDDRNITRIEFLRCDMNNAPKVGQSFKDCSSDFHRIQVVRKTELTWRCDCEVSPE